MLKRNKQKVFCIGLNKTGTTSLGKALEDFGFNVANQRTGELLLKDYVRRDFRPILKFCQTANVFQDIPFGTQFLFPILDYEFPNSKFILTIRDNEDEWYKSITEFHASFFGKPTPPLSEELRNADYCYKGWFWELFQDVFQALEEDPYNRSNLQRVYLEHIEAVKQYFCLKSNLLIINLKEPYSYRKLCSFLDKKPLYQKFPHISSRDLGNGNYDCKFLNFNS